MLNNVISVFDRKEELMKGLKKKSYEANMKVFRNANNHYFFEMTDYVAAAENKETAAKEIADLFVDEVEKKFVSGFRKKIPGAVQADLNFFMIYYVFPAILMTQHDDSKLIVETLCNVWGTRLKNAKISYTDYDTLMAAFKEKIFGIL